MAFSVGQVATSSALNAVTLASVSATTYTPVIANDGGVATYTTLTGWYFEIGASVVFFTAYVVVNAGGSGSSNVTITAPTNIDRTTRQVVPIDGENVGASTTLRSGWVVAFTGGSGAVFDRIKLINSASDGISNLTGAQLTNGEILTIQGWYRAA